MRCPPDAALDVAAVGRDTMMAAVSVGEREIENELLRISWDDDGLLTSVWDKEARREVLAPGGRGNMFQLHADLPNDTDAWDVDLHYFGDLYLVAPVALKKLAVPQSPAGTENPPDAPPTIVYRSYPGYYLPEFPYPNPVTGKTVDVKACNGG